MIRVAMIGMGPIGNLHADIHNASPLAELAGVCDIRKDRADAAAQRLGVPAFYSVDEMLKALSPDLCDVTTGGYEYGSDITSQPSRQSKQAAMCCAKNRSRTRSTMPKRWLPGRERSVSALE